MEELAILLFCFHTLLICTIATDTLSINQTIRDGETIVSAHKSFELGFFSPRNTSQNRYLGIWYYFATDTVVWVANRETPISNNKSGELTLNPGGLLVLRDSATNQIIWSSDASRETGNAVARLLDNSNFIVADEDEADDYIWQSFDHPTNNLMPDMKFGRNLKRGIVTNYTSWKSDDDPSPGSFMIYMNFSGYPRIFQKNGDGIQYRLGSWNGFAYSGNTNYRQNPFYRRSFYMDEIETSAVYTLINQSVFTRLTLRPDGLMAQWTWINRTQGWFMYSALTTDSCERYSLCGGYGICDIGQSPNCGCLRGFTPKSPDQWNMADWSNGCQRETPLDCGVGEGFRKYPFVKIPDTGESWFDRNMSLEQCKVKCTSECNCTAYATLDIKQGIGCLVWYTELIDMRTLPNRGQDMYIRVSATELEKDQRISRNKKKPWVIIIPAGIGFVILLGLCVMIIKKRKQKKVTPQAFIGRSNSIVHQDGLELPLFNLSTLIIATNNFSDNNKLGAGGFGPVYKGCLEDGREIAVKRLSVISTQGFEEFRNEVIFISKLQHRNLVKILGYCVEGAEKLLVYEFMPNSSLDLLLFGESKTKLIDWSQRFHIINGIARGLLYLHQDSRLRIIHRDLKAANILLDHEMKPKISDFGLARSFGGNETETNTKRVVGTYGYMSPEYAGDGIFSTKSDVFSFGILVLEIVSGKKSSQLFYQDQNHNVAGHAWRLYNEGKTLEFADESLIEVNDIEVLRSIHLALLCVQHSPEDRPDMSMVVMMLGSDRRLPEPGKPGYYNEDDKFGPVNSSSMPTEISNSCHTITQ